MDASGQNIDVGTLLREISWLRRLAATLVGNGSRADDLTQDTLVVALERQPWTAGVVSLRPWLSAVARKIVRHDHRDSARRGALDRCVASARDADTQPDLIERVDLQRRLVEAVLALDEPYRSAVVLRYFEGLTAVDVGVRQTCTSEAARQRVSRGLSMLRARLDRTFDGGRGAWCAIFAKGFDLTVPVEAARVTLGLSAAVPLAGGVVLSVKSIAIGLALAVLAIAGIGLYETGSMKSSRSHSALRIDIAPRTGGPDECEESVASEPMETASESSERTGVEIEEARSKEEGESTSEPAAVLGGLAAAVEFLRASLPERFGSLTLEEATTLVDLDLHGARVIDADLVHLAALPALENLSLRGTAITDAGLVHLYALSHLKALDFRDTQVSGAGIPFLPAYGLEALHLTGTRVTGHDLRSFPFLPNLRRFKLNRLDFGDESVADLALFPRVEHLELDETRITDDGLRLLLEQNPALKRIELRRSAVTPEGATLLQEGHSGVELMIDDGSAARYGMYR